MPYNNHARELIMWNLEFKNEFSFAMANFCFNWYKLNYGESFITLEKQ
jgi:hypothetical protein